MPTRNIPNNIKIYLNQIEQRLVTPNLIDALSHASERACLGLVGNLQEVTKNFKGSGLVGKDLDDIILETGEILIKDFIAEYASPPRPVTFKQYLKRTISSKGLENRNSDINILGKINHSIKSSIKHYTLRSLRPINQTPPTIGRAIGARVDGSLVFPEDELLHIRKLSSSPTNFQASLYPQNKEEFEFDDNYEFFDKTAHKINTPPTPTRANHKKTSVIFSTCLETPENLHPLFTASEGLILHLTNYQELLAAYDHTDQKMQTNILNVVRVTISHMHSLELATEEGKIYFFTDSLKQLAINFLQDAQDRAKISDKTTLKLSQA